MKCLFFILLFLVSCKDLRGIKINVIKTGFYDQNKDMVDEAVEFYEKHCKTKESLLVNLQIDTMPQELIYISYHQIGITSSFKDLTLVEINPYLFFSSSYLSRKNTIYHELGHVIGLEHSENPKSIMFDKNSDSLNLVNLESEIKSQCSKITDVPRSQTFLLKN